MQIPTMSRARRSPNSSYSLVLPTTSANTMATSISLPIPGSLYLMWRGRLKRLRGNPLIEYRNGRIQGFGHRLGPCRDLGQEPAPGARALSTGHQTVHVPRDRVQAYAPARADLRIGDDPLDDLLGLRQPPVGIDQDLLQLGEQGRPVVGRTAEHDSIHSRIHMMADFRGLRQAAVQYHGQLRPFLFEPVHVVVLEGRNLTILLGRQAAQNRSAGVDDERIDADAGDRIDEGGKEGIV